MQQGMHSMHSGLTTIITSFSQSFPFLRRSQIPKSNIRYRYILAFLCMIGMATIASTKVIYKVAVESIFKDVSENTNGNRDIVLSSYYWGYCLLGCLGGRLAEIYSAKWIIFFGNVLYLLLHLFTPLMLRLNNMYVLLVSRIVSGVATGISYPALIVLMARWSPPAERYILCGIAFGGIYLGFSNAVFITMFITTREHWEHSFYVSGASVALWLIFHSVYVHDYPQIRKGLKIDELNYITSSLENDLYDKKNVRKAKTPWKSILTSPPFYVLLIVHCCIQLIFWLSFHRMVNDIKHYFWLSNMSQLSRGVLLSLPFAWALLVTLFVGLVLSTLIHQEAISKPAALRFAVTIGLVTPVVCLTIDYVAQSDWELVVIPMILVMLAGINNMVQANHIEISPNYAGTLMGITYSVSSFWGVVIRYIVPEDVDENRRRLLIVYGVTILFCLVSMLVYILFLSADVQKWNWTLKDSRRFSNIMMKEKTNDKGKDKSKEEKKGKKKKEDNTKEKNKDNKKGKNKDNKKEKNKDNKTAKKKDNEQEKNKDNKKEKNKDNKKEKNKDNKKDKNKDNKKEKNKDNKKEKNEDNKKEKNKDNNRVTNKKKKKEKPITLRTKQHGDNKKKKPKINKKSKKSKEIPKDQSWFDWMGPSTSK